MSAAAASNAIAITPEIVKEHGLTQEEYQRACDILGREPNITELGIFSVMWSEHCSYKTTRKWLRTLPTEAPHVICGPGENAGVISIGDGQAIIFKMESHNHPSFIEPFQGAATGVGGILRDVFTMGARPIALMNALRFGEPSHPKTRHLVGGVVSGISHYGNCVGVPTVGGECTFHASYNGNILVNAMAVGLADASNIFYSAAAGVGNPVVYVGSKTGRDGIHGATMASAEFTDATEEKRPTVQVGDPFTEKLLIEACLELMATDAILAIQDMGAAGLTSSSLEMSSKGGSGIELDLDKVPMRESGMTPYEIMLSESQERMLMVLKPGKEHIAEEIFTKWGLDCATIGRLTDTGNLVLKMHGEVYADMPAAALADEAPVYDRPWNPAPKLPTLAAEDVAEPEDYGIALRKLIGSPDLCSKRWIWEQYDHMVMNDTVMRPGGDSAVVRIHDTKKGLAITTDCTPRYCAADPIEGGKQAVAETWRNLTAVGAKPLAITNCLNFPNPEKPDNMGQIVGCLQGMAEACRALDYPIVSGNVSLYNETNGKGVQPTPAIGGVGLLDDAQYARGLALVEGLEIVLLGTTKGHLGASIYLREIAGREEGAPPPVDLAEEKRIGNFVRSLILRDKLAACHDLSDGGLLITLTEMCMAGKVGAHVVFPEDLPRHAFAFGEDQARYLVAVPRAGLPLLLGEAEATGIPALHLGRAGGDSLVVSDMLEVSIAELRATNEAWLPNYMSGKL
ncbi:MAG: phosphoribosylformylglycinamidine synthase subunit PurL [Alphaproteobacteria bacterium]|nr:phosphoribosylformylglycinamidine synthase subunit PurL [Alphaproteobacteria bacterium]